jgi:DNA-binding MarR family transcriptional regulator
MTSRQTVSVAALRGALREMLAAQRRLRGREAARRDDLSISQHAILSVLAHGAMSSCRELAASAGLTPASTTRMVDGLVREGLVYRVRDTTDRRLVRVLITDEGRRRFEDKDRRLRAIWEAWVDAMDETDVESTPAALRRISPLFDAL